MKFMIKWGLALVPALALATPALALAPAGLSDSQQPGSVIVFPKFIGGAPGATGSAPRVPVDGIAGLTVSRTEIEIGAVCPASGTPGVGPCAAHAPVVVNFHWVCPGFEGVNSNICNENSFFVTLSVDGKLVFSADSIPINTNSPRTPAPLCPRGYLIGWVVNNVAAAQPIKFDGLVGNAVIRGPVVASTGTSTALSAYAGITIQATPNVGAVGETANPGGLITTAAAGGLPFTGNLNQYTQITGVQIADVRFDQTNAATAIAPPVLSETFLTFLTLDVRSGRGNNPTFVPYLFFNESNAQPSTTNPLFENPTDGTLSFVCWTQLSLATVADPDFGGPLDRSLTQAFQATRKGIVIAGPARKDPDGNAPGDVTGAVTLIGMVDTIEGTSADNFQNRKYNFLMSTDGNPVPTTFFP